MKLVAKLADIKMANGKLCAQIAVDDDSEVNVGDRICDQKGIPIVTVLMLRQHRYQKDLTVLILDLPLRLPKGHELKVIGGEEFERYAQSRKQAATK